MTKKVTIKIPYGKGSLKCQLRRDRLLGILQSKAVKGGDVKKMLCRSLDSAENKKLLEGVVRDRRRVLIAVPDATRSAHLKKILPVLIGRIEAVNAKCAVDIMIATGLHKKLDPRVLRLLLGDGVVKKHKVINHELDKRSLMRLGRTDKGIPVTLNKKLKDYDVIVSIGLIEPHLYAGYSGGAKTVAIGLAGEETISATHGIRFLDDPKVNIGSVSGNPFQETLWRIVKDIRIAFSVNIVNNSEGKALRIFSGATRDVFKKGVDFAKTVFALEVERPSDIVICGIGYPKDVNLYQASRAINYITNVDNPVLKKGGCLIVAAELKDGIGEGIGEKRFHDEMKKMASPEDFVRKTKRAGCVAGVHRAYMAAKPLIDYNVIFVTRGHKGFMNNIPFNYFDNIQEALKAADSIMGDDAKIYVVPRALATIARVNRR